MDIDLMFLVAAFGGGAFGAAIGGQPAFIFTGFMVFIGVAFVFAGSEFDFLGVVAFGPIFGPHISFAGGAAAAAYAARRGQLEIGRDIATPLTGVSQPGPLVVGGLFGVGGYIVNQFLAGILDGAEWTDTVALTVTISAIATRLMFGRTGLFGSYQRDPDAPRNRLSISSDAVWVAHQGSWAQTAALGLASGLISALAVVQIAEATDPETANAVRVLLFGVSAVSLLLLQFGMPGPVTHHMTLPAAVGAGVSIAAGADPGVAFALGVLMGVVGAILGELAARLFLIHGDTHLDPPAISIFICTTIVLLADMII